MTGVAFNISNSPANAARDCAAVAKLGGDGVRVSLEEGWGTPSAMLGPYRRACDDNGLWLMECAQPTGHLIPRTQKRLDGYGVFCGECASIADYTSSANEFNGYGCNETPDPKATAQMVLAVIAHAPKGRQLLTPSVQPASGGLGSRYVEPLLWMLTMLDVDHSILTSGMWIDWHGYCDGRYNPNTAQTWNTAYRTRLLAKKLAHRGFPNQIVTWSECGTATGPSGWAQRVSESDQALRLTQLIAERTSQEAAGVHHGPTVLYDLRDYHAANDSDWPACAGAYRLDGTAKAEAATFKKLAAA